MRLIVCTALVMLAAGLPSLSFGQVTDEESQAVARAKATRQRVVEEFGSPAQMAAFVSGPAHNTPAKLPKLPHRLNKIGPEDMPAINDYFASRQQPFEVYDNVFSGLAYPELYRAPMLENERYALKSRAIARLEASALWELYGFVPTEGSVMLERSVAGIPNRAEAKIEAHQEELVSLARMKESVKLLAMMLTAKEVEEFRQGTYRFRAALLFKAARIAVDKAELPSPYVLELCDPNPRMDSYGAGTRAMMAQMAPQNPAFGEANWRGLSEFAKWRAVTAAQREFLRSGEAYFTASSQAGPVGSSDDENAFLLAIPPSGAYRNAAILVMMGPHGAAAWKQANPPEQKRMERTAGAMNAALEILLNTLIVEVREAELKAQDSNLPIAATPEM